METKTTMTMMPKPGHFFEDLHVGMEARFSKTVTEADILGFAHVSGDQNPLHIDANYAATTVFKERIAHGMLTASYISAAFAMELPGPGCVYISQSLNFRGPVKIGDTVVAHIQIRELLVAKKRAIFECKCLVAGKSVLEGEAVLMVPSRPA